MDATAAMRGRSDTAFVGDDLLQRGIKLESSRPASAVAIEPMGAEEERESAGLSFATSSEPTRAEAIPVKFEEKMKRRSPHTLRRPVPVYPRCCLLAQHQVEVRGTLSRAHGRCCC